MPTFAKPTFAKLSFARPSRTVAAATLAAGLLAVGTVQPAAAQTAPAPAAQRCSGTLCDLYYGSGASASAKADSSPSASQQGVPTTVPTGNIFSGLFTSSGGTQAAPAGAANAQRDASAPFVRVVGGRPANERCTGTLCDIYYSGSDPSPSAAAPPVGRQASAAPVAGAGSVAAPVRKHVAAPQPKPLCHNERDPWQCYR